VSLDATCVPINPFPAKSWPKQAHRVSPAKASTEELLVLEDEAVLPAELAIAEPVALAWPMVLAEPEAVPVRLDSPGNPVSRDNSAHVPMPPLDPDVADLAPSDPALTLYDV
jgi:hypothetical protein